MNEIKYWLWLSMVFGTGSRRIWEAMNLFENPREAYNALKSGKVDVTLSEHETKNIKNTTLEQVHLWSSVRSPMCTLRHILPRNIRRSSDIYLIRPRFSITGETSAV